MENFKPISPKMHGIADYVLIGSMLAVPYILGFDKKIKTLYTAEALVLLPYAALSDHPAAVKPLIRSLRIVK